MRYQQDLQIGLRERLRRLMVTDFSTVTHEVRLVVDWINKQHAILAILTGTQHAEPDLDHDAFCTSVSSRGHNGWPSATEEGRTALIWTLMRRIADDDRMGKSGDHAALTYAYGFGGNSHNINDQWRGFVEQILQPLFDYLSERIGAEASVLYVLERYVRRIEWFDREELFNRAQADPRNAEGIYDVDLRRFLFSEGFDMPFSQAKSASGLSDIVSDLDTDDPLVCELKLFDGKDRGKRHIASGVHQALQYANDYAKHVAYLVVINISGRPLNLPSDAATGMTWPPHIEIGGVRVHLIAVRARPMVSASKLGKPSPVTVTYRDLVDPDVTDDDT